MKKKQEHLTSHPSAFDSKCTSSLSGSLCSPAGGKWSLCYSYAPGTHCLVSSFTCLKPNWIVNYLREEILTYICCVLTGLRIIVQNRSDQVTTQFLESFCSHLKHITNCPVALPQLLASSYWLHQFNSFPCFTSVIFILHQLPVCSAELGS